MAKQQPRKTILHQAQETISGAREAEYGNKLQNFSQSAMLIQGYLAPKMQPGAVITPEDIAGIMVCMKLSRASKSPDHFDSWLDIAGYVGCVDALQQDRAAGKELLGATSDTRAVV